MRLIKGIKNKASGIFTYVYDFSKGQAAAGLGAGAGTVYFLGEVLKKVIGNIPAFSIGLVSGTVVGIITIYGAEKDNKKLIEEILEAIETEKNDCKQLEIKYFKMIGKHDILASQQIAHRTNNHLFQILQNIFSKLHQRQPIKDEDLQVKTDIYRVSTLSHLTGGISSRLEDPLEKTCLNFNIDNAELSEHKENDPGFLKNVLLFLRNSTAFPRAIMLSYLAMISYYLEYSLEEIAEVDLLIAWPCSIFFAIVSSPIIVYTTTAPSRNQLTCLQKQLTLLNEFKIELKNGLSKVEQSYGELKQLIPDPQNYQMLLTNLSQKKPSEINLESLSNIFQEFNKSQLVTRRRFSSEEKTPQQPRKKPDSLTILPPTPRTPLLKRGDSSINSPTSYELEDLKKSNDQVPDATETRLRCAIL